MKRVCKGMLVLVFILTGLMSMGMISFAAEQKGDGFYYELNEKGEATLTRYISGSGYIKSGKLEIPEQIDGHTVVAIGDGFTYYETAIQELSIPGTVKELGDRCFIGASNLTKLTFRGEGLETIGSQAFFHSALTTFSIPSTVKKVEYGAFSYIKATSVTVPASVESWGTDIFYNSSTLKKIVFEDGFSKITKDFLGISSADQIIIPATVTEIEAEAFSDVDIKSVTIYGKNTILKDRAFLKVADVYCYRDSKAYDYFINASYQSNIHIMGPYLETETFELDVDETVQLRIINNNGTITWSSSDSNIARVDSSGNVKALKPGTVTVTVVVGDTTLTAAVKVRDLKFDEKNVSVTVGFQTKLKLVGGKNVKWKSSNKKIATVSSKGVVKGKKKGTVTITATCYNRKYKCKVKVKENKRTLDSYPTDPNRYPYNIAAIGFRSVSQDKKGNFVLKGHVINTYPQTVRYIDNLTVTITRNGKVIAKQKYGRLNINVGRYSYKAITLTINKKNIKKNADVRTGTVKVTHSGGKVYSR